MLCSIIRGRRSRDHRARERQLGPCHRAISSIQASAHMTLTGSAASLQEQLLVSLAAHQAVLVVGF